MRTLLQANRCMLLEPIVPERLYTVWLVVRRKRCLTRIVVECIAREKRTVIRGGNVTSTRPSALYSYFLYG